MSSLLRVEHLSKRFGGLQAVADVSLDVTAGEICSVIGPNGAGKTTLFNMISGVLQPSGGRILFDGVDLATISPLALRCNRDRADVPKPGAVQARHRGREHPDRPAHPSALQRA